MTNEAIEKFNSGMKIIGCEAYIEVKLNVTTLVLGNINIEELRIPQGVEVISRHTKAEDISIVDELKRVYIPDSVRIIGYMSFSRMEKLVEVVGARKITEVNDHAFERCTRLNEAIFPKLERLGKNSFSFCKNLARADIGKVDVIPYASFIGCDTMESIQARNVSKIGVDAFGACYRFKRFDGEKVYEVGENAFYKCACLKNLQFKPATIGRSAFMESGIEKIDLGMAKLIGQWAFYRTGLSGRVGLSECMVQPMAFKQTQLAEVVMHDSCSWSDNSFESSVKISNRAKFSGNNYG